MWKRHRRPLLGAPKTLCFAYIFADNSKNSYYVLIVYNVTAIRQDLLCALLILIALQRKYFFLFQMKNLRFRKIEDYIQGVI